MARPVEMWRRPIGWLVAVIVLAACKNGADVVKEYRPKAEPRLAQMTAAVTAATAAPAEAVSLPERLRFTGDHANAALVQASWFVGERERDSLLTYTGDVISVQRALRGDTSGVPSYYENAFKTFLGLDYLVVVDVSIYSGAITGEKEFSGGSASGSLNIVDIDAKKSVGFLSFSSEHGDKIAVVEGHEEKSMHSDLWMKARQAANAALAPHLAPDQKPPF